MFTLKIPFESHKSRVLEIPTFHAQVRSRFKLFGAAEKTVFVLRMQLMLFGVEL
jgi:hypothetical protein